MVLLTQGYPHFPFDQLNHQPYIATLSLKTKMPKTLRGLEDVVLNALVKFGLTKVGFGNREVSGKTAGSIYKWIEL